MKWQVRRLAEACEIKPHKSEARRRLAPNDMVSFVPMEDLGIDQKFVRAEKTRVMSDVIGSYTYFTDGDVLLAKITPCFENGKLGIAANLLNGTGFGSSEYIVFRPSQDLDSRWLYYFLSRDQFRAEGEARMGGAVGHKRVAKEFVENYKIPVPPLHDQHRIVALLDQAFSGIAAAKANAEQNRRNAREAFDGQLSETFSKRSSGWIDSTVGEQVLLQRGFDITKDQQREGDVPVVSSGGIKSYHNAAMVRGPGVVMGRKGTLGKVFYLERDYWPHDTTLWVKDFKRNNPRLVYYFFSGLDVSGLDSGAANPALNRNQIHPLRVCWPPLDEQEMIVTRLDSLAQETQRLESIYARKTAALEDLKQSLLQQAFSGQL